MSAGTARTGVRKAFCLKGRLIAKPAAQQKEVPVVWRWKDETTHALTHTHTHHMKQETEHRGTAGKGKREESVTSFPVLHQPTKKKNKTSTPRHSSKRGRVNERERGEPCTLFVCVICSAPPGEGAGNKHHHRSVRFYLSFTTISLSPLTTAHTHARVYN